MSTVWIIHRDTRSRAAMARLAAVGETAVQAGPGDPMLADAPPADVVVLGVGEDCENELQFVHRVAPGLPNARWILLTHRADFPRTSALFDTLDSTLLAWPPDARELRAKVHAPPTTGSTPLPLSQRPVRDAVSSRFARWFADLELPELLRILDPRLVDVPLLISGERGTGRGLLARYVHSFGGTAGADFLHVPCSDGAGADELLAAIGARAGRSAPGRGTNTIWLEDLERLPAATQQVLAGWIEYALPAGAVNLHRLRWIGTAGPDDAGLEDRLIQGIGGFRVRIPALRERTEMLAAFANETAAAICNARRQRPRRFGEDAIAVLEEYPWPGNLRELEGVVEQTLLTSSTDPIRADDLQHQGLAFAPVSATDLGALLVDEAEDGVEDELDSVFEPLPEAVFEDETDAMPPPAPPPAPSGSENAGGEDPGLARLARAVAHEVRNPLTTIKTFAELLPAQFQDREFREQFSELVGRGVDRIEEVVQELSRLAAFDSPAAEPVDITRLLEELLEQRRETIHARHLLVLKELERNDPLVLGDATQLRFALEALLDKCLEIVPERGDVYFASKHHAGGLHGQPSTRLLVRFHGPDDGEPLPSSVPGTSLADNALEFALAEAVARAQGGALTVQTSEGDETVLVLDLPSPSESGPA